MHQKIANGENKVLEILYEDLESFFRKEDEKDLVNDFRTNTIRYTKVFGEIAQKMMPQRSRPIL
jgi:glycyl-tRNA synthetase beta subunit